MANPRFYVPNIPYEEGQPITLPEEASHHAMHVLRLRNKDRIDLFSGNGLEASGLVQFNKTGTSLILDSVTTTPEPKLRIILLQSVISNEKMDWVIEKACETGVSKIVVFPSSRGEIKLTGEKIVKRLDRWKKIAVSACMQCRQNRIPEILFVSSLDRAFEHAEGRCFVTAPSLEKTPTGDCPQGCVSFLIGPEGGLTNGEIQLALDNHFEARLLGPRVLRTETAGITASVWAQTLWGDLT